MTNELTNADRCAVCGGMLALIGVRHRCIPNLGRPSPFGVKPASPERAKADQERVVDAAPREITYRYRDPEKWRAYMRDYMKKKRAKKV